jgi:hypothetical protein
VKAQEEAAVATDVTPVEGTKQTIVELPQELRLKGKSG